MPIQVENLAWEDKIKLSLSALYEMYGFEQYRMGKFEPYDMYHTHKDFLRSEALITFTDTAGRLMALKPDVTMSIVRSIQKEELFRKLYYVENVFRVAPGRREYGEISQIGIESIGGDDPYTEAEVLMLAVKTLEEISPRYVLNLSHMGFVAAVMSACGLDMAAQSEALEALTQKNSHALREIGEKHGADAPQKQLLQQLAAASGEVEETIRVFESLSLNAQMEAALHEIRRVYQALSAIACKDKLCLDFTVVNNMDYYNGIVFKGYIESLPRAVLEGGRYDNLLRRFGKPQSALGFALYLGELTRVYSQRDAYDTDVLLIYGDTPPETVMRTVSQFQEKGQRVRAQQSPSAGVRVREVYYMEKDGTLEVANRD